MTTRRWLGGFLAAALSSTAWAQDAGTAAKAAPPAVRLPVLVVLPPATDDAATREYAMLLQARAYGQLLATNRFALPHIKQVLAMTAGEGLKADQLKTPADAERAAKRLGADGFVFGSLAADGKGFVLTASAQMLGSKKIQKVSQKLDLNEGTVKSIEEAGDALATALYKVAVTDKKPLELQDVPPSTLSDPAMRSFARCYGTLMRQPAGIENPTVLDEGELREAVLACEQAAKGDPGFSGAQAGLALAFAILGDDTRAVKALKLVGAADAMQPLAWQARFWLVTRYESGAAGEQVLREAIALQPGFLLARSYLAELLDTLGEHEKAGFVWKAYSEQVPGDPFIRTRLARSLARQGKHAEAIALGKEVVAANPNSRDAKLQLASCYIDANQWDEAVGVLEQLRALPEASADVFLRLGWATFRKGDFLAAKPLYEEALARATKPGHWRMRGRAHYDLALVHLKSQDPAKAEESLKAALATGFRMRDVDPAAQAILKKIERADVSNAGAKGKVPYRLLPKAPALPREVSLFPVNAFGEVDPNAKPEKPDGFLWSTGDFK
jgi:tetratricopeptide (TPR) repeat protein